MNDHDSDPPRSTRATDSILKWLPMIGAICIVAGGYARMETTLATMTEQQRSDHAELAAHVASTRGDGEQIRALQVQASHTDDTLRSLVQSMQDMKTNVLLVCRATKGADCIR